jgi:hypothetical protein
MTDEIVETILPRRLRVATGTADGAAPTESLRPVLIPALEMKCARVPY